MSSSLEVQLTDLEDLGNLLTKGLLSSSSYRYGYCNGIRHGDMGRRSVFFILHINQFPSLMKKNGAQTKQNFNFLPKVQKLISVCFLSLPPWIYSLQMVDQIR
ncbi:hypothetical protein AVEN_212339-1 [Araneus ventricosus]|uniref:Uncharacterized protein n=1 Tax=Araneus ventricosus TaxID=182803 RepID=A0A4Y2F288_ARAVE|nr:hypothetical protein AVEN_212339-1 [Araneus ventricosus]